MSRIRLVEIGAARAVDRTPRPSLLASAGVPILVAAGPHGHDATIYANVYARVRRRYASGDQHLRPSARRNRMERREELRGGLWITGALNRANRRVPLTNLFSLWWPGAGSAPSTFRFPDGLIPPHTSETERA